MSGEPNATTEQLGSSEPIKAELVDVDPLLTRENASIEQRKAGYSLLKAAASQPATPEKRREYYDQIITPVDRSIAHLQIEALVCLTDSGKEIEPFITDIVNFLNVKLVELTQATESARRRNATSAPSTSVQEATQSTRTASTRISSGTATHSELDTTTTTKESANVEKALADTFYLISDICSYHGNAFHGERLETLLSNVINITQSTTIHKALRGSVKIISSILGRGRIPSAIFESVLRSLCAVFGSLSFSPPDQTWNCLKAILTSQDAMVAGSLLIEILLLAKDAPNVQQLSEIRGALLSLDRIVEDDYLTDCANPNWPSLMSGLRHVCHINVQTTLGSLNVVRSLLSNDRNIQAILYQDWSSLQEVLGQLDVAQAVSDGYARQPILHQLPSTLSSLSPLYLFAKSLHVVAKVKDPLIDDVLENIARSLLYEIAHSRAILSIDKQAMLMNVVLGIARRIHLLYQPIIEMMLDNMFLDPTNPDWAAHLEVLVNCVNTSWEDADMNQQALLKALQRVYLLIDHNPIYQQAYEGVVAYFCNNLSITKPFPLSVLEAMSELLTDIGTDVSSSLFATFLKKLEEGYEANQDDNGLKSRLRCVPRCLTRLFLLCYRQSYPKTVNIYSWLLRICSGNAAVEDKIHAISLLVRLRCASNYAIYIAPQMTAEQAVVELCQSEVTLEDVDVIQQSSSRTSMLEQTDEPRIGRSSVADFAVASRSRSATRSTNVKERRGPLVRPDWYYNESIQSVPYISLPNNSLVVYAQNAARYGDDDGKSVLDVGAWLNIVINILERQSDWEIYSYILVHTPHQLGNYSLFSSRISSLQILHSTAVGQLQDGTFPDAPDKTGIEKGDVALVLYQMLTALLPYHQILGRRMTEATVYAFRIGVAKWDRTSKSCIHALALCCFELPFTIKRQLSKITDLMQKREAKAELAVDILEFLGCLLRNRSAYGDADTSLYKQIFQICLRYLQRTSEQKNKVSDGSKPHMSAKVNRQSGVSSGLIQETSSDLSPDMHGIAEYVFAMAHQMIISWFLAINVLDRAKYVRWLIDELAWQDKSGKKHLGEQGKVLLDMMHRTAYSDLGETEASQSFEAQKDGVIRHSWLIGMSVVTTEIITDPETGRAYGQLTKRQASGTTHATYYHNTAEIPIHHQIDESPSSPPDSQHPFHVYPNHMLLQLISNIAPTPTPIQPIRLAEDEIRSVINVFDSIDTVDGHKAGVLFVGKDQHGKAQQTEAEILANSTGNEAYDAFISGLGTNVPLKGAKFNAQGLDRRTGEDGTDTIAWRDRISEIVFHVATMMPTNLTDDEHCHKKKQHIGNDHVKIIYNASGEAYDTETINTAFNMINIVITPEAPIEGQPSKMEHTPKVDDDLATSRTLTEDFGYFKVETISAPGCPRFSSAADAKTVSADVLPLYVRQIVLTASVFCQIWTDRNRKGEYISSWRARLREILRLREKYAKTHTEGDDWTGTVAMGGMMDSQELINNLDFTRWTL